MRRQGERIFSRTKTKRVLGWLLTVSFAFTIGLPALLSTSPAYAITDEALEARSGASESAGERTEGSEPPATSGEICDLDGLDFIEGAKCVIFLGIYKLLELIAFLLGRLILMIVEILLAFASYNSFNSSPVVQLGWRLVRDVVNMFFIVIVLVSAFSTIIGYWDDFNYKRVLPKLLVMAVLVNFSRTLIQLLIDFSQVVMLTFVNAFRSAGAGNFSAALGLHDMLRLAPPVEGGVGGEGVGAAEELNIDPNNVVNLTNIIIAMMLAVFMLSIALAVLIILTAYLLFRIIGLWMALIFSPVAFFATALPDRLKKGLDAFTGKYWQRLSSMLTGGPVIAFFLWLTLATVQRTNSSGGGGLAPALDLGTGDTPFLINSGVGNSNAIASFIVGISMLLMGLEAAVASATQISSTLGKFAGQVQGAGFSLGRLAALSPFLLGAAGARAVDRRADITRRASALGLATLGRVPGLRGIVREPLARGLVMRRREAAEEAKRAEALAGEVSRYGEDKELKALGRTYGYGATPLKTLASRAESSKIAEILASDELRDREAKRGRKAEQEKLMPGLVDKYRQQGYSEDEAAKLAEPEAKAGADVLSKQTAMNDQRDYVQKQLELARSLKDEEKIEKLEKWIKQNPHLAGEDEKDKIAGDLATDPEQYKDVGKWDAMNGQVLTAFMMKHGWEEDANTHQLVQKDAAAWDRLKKSVKASGNTSLLEGLEAHESFVLSSPAGTVNEYKALQHRKNPADGTVQAFDKAKGDRVRNGRQAAAYTALATAGRARTAGQNVSQADMRNFIMNNGPLKELLDASRDSLDGQPSNDLAVSINQGTTAASRSLATGDANQAVKDLEMVTKVLSQIDAQGISADQQTKILGGFAGGGGKEIVKQIDKLPVQVKQQVMKALEVLRDRVDDIRINVPPGQQTAAQRLSVTMLDDLVNEMNTNPKQIPPAVRTILRKTNTP